MFRVARGRDEGGEGKGKEESNAKQELVWRERWDRDGTGKISRVRGWTTPTIKAATKTKTRLILPLLHPAVHKQTKDEIPKPLEREHLNRGNKKRKRKKKGKTVKWSASCPRG